MKLCHTATVFVFSLAAVQFQSKPAVITVKAAAGTFLHFLVLFAGTRAAWVQTGDRLAYLHRRAQTCLLIPKHEV